MKKFTYRIAFLIIAAFFSLQVSAKVWTIQVADFTFSPANLTHVTALDTIIWQWESGTHTTTSNTIPAGALDWDEPVDINNKISRYIPTINGTYTYVCTFHPNMTGRFVVSGANGIPEPPKMGAKVSPNPFGDFIKVNVDPGTEVMNVKMFDLMGKQILIQEVNGSPAFSIIDLGELAPGYYMLSFTTRDNRTFSRRVTHK